MTYCLAIKVKEGLVFASDSRTNAGLDHVSTYSKMYSFLWPGNRSFVLLSAGNLATTQAVAKQLRTDAENPLAESLLTVPNTDAAADYIGRVSVAVQRNQAERDNSNSLFEATFIFGGQIAGQESAIFLVYPQGNYIHESPEHPFLQIGEIKYGKPILDRVIRRDTPLELAGRCALVSLNSTIRSNLTVGPPVELLFVPDNDFAGGHRLSLSEDDPFYRAISDAWSEGLRQALNRLPSFPWEATPRTAQFVQQDSSAGPMSS